MPALPALRFRDEALMRLVGFKAHQVRHGVCHRGAATRQGPRTTGPIGAEALADNLVKRHLRDLEAWFNGVIRALTTAGGLAATLPGLVEATALETTAPYEGGGQVTRTRRMTDTRGKVHELEVTVDGCKRIVCIEARTTIPLAAKIVPMQAHETRSLRALVTPARPTRAGHARRHQVVVDRGFWDGVALWWLAPQGLLCVVPAQENLAVTLDAQAQAAVGEGVPVGRRVHTVRHGQGKTAWSERLETAVVGITGLTTDDQSGTPEHGRQAHRRDCQPTPITAVVVRRWNGHESGPAGQTGFLPKAAVAKPLPPFDDDEDRRLSEHGWIKERKPPWRVKHPPQQPARAVRVHVLFTVRMFALATAYRLPCEQADTGKEPVGWQRWRRQLLEPTRAIVIIVAEGSSGICHLAEYSLLLGVNIKDRPTGIGTRQQILAKYGLIAHG